MTSPLYVAHIALWVAVGFQGLAICALLYKNNRLLEIAATGGIVSQHAAGSSAPRFLATDLRTRAVVSSDELMESRTFLLFITPACPACLRLMRDLSDACSERGRRFEKLLVYCVGSSRECANANERNLLNLNGMALLTEHDAKVADLFGVRTLPALVELDYAWRIAGYFYPSTWEDITSIMPQDSGRVEGR